MMAHGSGELGANAHTAAVSLVGEITCIRECLKKWNQRHKPSRSHTFTRASTTLCRFAKSQIAPYGGEVAVHRIEALEQHKLETTLPSGCQKLLNMSEVIMTEYLFRTVGLIDAFYHRVGV
jgi:hypothetical protein